MPDADFSDRRIFERIPAKLSLKLVDLRFSKEASVYTHDVSAKGIGLVASEELLPYTPLELWLQMPDKGEPLYTRGEVVWSRRLEPNKYRVGVSLEKAELMGMSRILREPPVRPA